MRNLLKSTIVGVGLLAGVAATAQAQSVSTLPPTTNPAANATTPPVSSAKIYPSPGNAAAWSDQHYQATENENDRARQPYSARDMGPKPN